MVHRIRRGYSFRLIDVVAASIQVTHVLRKAGRRHLHAYALALLQLNPGRNRGEIELLDVAVFHEYLFVLAVTVAGPQDRAVDDECRSIRQDIDKLDREISVACIG